MKLQDSGERRKFTSGAVRDISEGKGRTDLLPLSQVAWLLPDKLGVLNHIDTYITTGCVDNLTLAVKLFINEVLQIDIYTAMLEVAKHYEDGAKKYEERNWEKGIPLHCYIDSGVRHYLKYMRGDRDEPHHRAFIWNMLCAMWTHENKPEMIDLPFKQ